MKKPIKIVLVIVIVIVIVAVGVGAYVLSQRDEAEAAALRHAGLEESQVNGLHSNLEIDGLSFVYDVSFFTQDAQDTQYEYEVSAFGHQIRKFDKDVNDSGVSVGTGTQDGQTTEPGATGTGGTVGDGSQSGSNGQAGGNDGASAGGSSVQSGTQSAPTAAPVISEADAKATVLQQAGLQEADISRYQSKLDYEDGVQVYEITFFAGGYEYDYEVSASSGEILKYDKERER